MYVLGREVCEGESVTCLDAAVIQNVNCLARVNETTDRCFQTKCLFKQQSIRSCLLRAPYELTETFPTLLLLTYFLTCGPGGSVGIATEQRAGLSGIEPQWGRDFLPVQIGPGALPASCTTGTGSFQGVKCGRGVLLTTHPLLVPRSWKSRAIPLPTLWATPGL